MGVREFGIRGKGYPRPNYSIKSNIKQKSPRFFDFFDFWMDVGMVYGCHARGMGVNFEDWGEGGRMVAG